MQQVYSPKVSIVVPFFDAENFLQEAIESVLNQTYQNWEMLLVDDGSTDRSTSIALEYARSYLPKIRYLQHESHINRGTSATRNLGIRHSLGTMIALLDADDVWFPMKLDEQLNILETHTEAWMVFGACQYWNSWSGNPEDAERDFVVTSSMPANTVFQPPVLSTLNYPLGSGSAPPPSSILFRRALWERIGGFEEDFTGAYGAYEDQVFLVKTYLNYPVFVSGQCWNRYRLHPGSCCARVAAEGRYEAVRQYFLQWLSQYLQDNNIRTKAIWKALRRAQWLSRHPVAKQVLDQGQRLDRAARRQFRKICSLL